MDQGGQECRQVDSALLPDLPGKPRSSATLRLGVQPRELPPPAGTSKERAAVVADHAEGEARQDRCHGHPARQVRDVPAGGSRRAPTTLRFDPQTDRQTEPVARSVSVRLATLAQARLRRRLLAYARERLCTDGKKDGISCSKRTKRPVQSHPTPPVDGMAAGGDTFSATIGREAFRGMVIWEIPVRRNRLGDKR